MADELAKKMTALRIRKQMEDAGEKLLVERNIQPGDTVLPAMPPVEAKGATVRVKTNVFSMDMQKEVNVFHYHVEGRFLFDSTKPNGEQRDFEYTSQRREDALAIEHTRISRRMFLILQSFHPNMLPQEGRYIYDGASQLFTLEPLKDGAAAIEIKLSCEEWPDLKNLRKGLVAVLMKLKKTERITRLGQVMRSLPANIKDNQGLAPLVQFVELATSESAAIADEHILFRNGVCILKDGIKHGYAPTDSIDLDGGGFLAHGCKKSARAMGDGAQVKFGLVIDPKIAPFHRVELLSEKALFKFPNLMNGANGSVQQVSNLLKGLFFLPVHRNGSAAPMQVHGLSSLDANTATIEHGDQNITIAQYFKQKYGVNLQHPKMPLIEVKRRGQKELYPMELCEVADNQRFGPHLITAGVQQEILKMSTRIPSILQRDILNNLKAFGLSTSVPLSQAHLKVAEQPIEVPARVLGAPKLQYKNFKTGLDLLKGFWENGKYEVPAKISKWAMFSLTRPGGEGGNDLTREQAIEFGVAFVKAAQNKGVQIRNADYFEVKEVPRNGGEAKFMDELMMNLRNHGFQFVLVIGGPYDESIHDTLKFYERQWDVLTQHVLSTTAKGAAGIGDRPKRQTMENIVNKANAKNGGINYVVGADEANNQLGSRDLFIGVSSNISGGGFMAESRGPTVVGYAANDKQHPAEYTGNYVFQEALRDEKLKVIEGIVRVALERFMKNRGHAPDRVFLYRNSSSEGSYEHLMRFEIPLVQAALRPTGAKLVFVVATRMHNIRFTPAVLPPNTTKAMEQNLKPGTCIDSGITNPYVPEFFLLGHVGRLGTTKVPRYSVLCNEAGISMEDLQRTTFFLCFGHQIIPGTTSLPSPIYIGDEMAKRGRAIYNQASSLGDPGTNSDDFNSISEQYDYAACPRLRDLRFNA